MRASCLSATVAALALCVAAPSAAEAAEGQMESTEKTATAEKSVPAPIYQEGDWWLVRGALDPRGRPRRARIVRIEDGRITIDQGGDQAETIYDLQLNKIDGVGPPSGRRVSYDPHTYNFDFPLRAGKTWGGEVEWSAPPYEGTFRVVAVARQWEETTLELSAGPRRGEVEKLHTLRIDYEHHHRGHVVKSTCWYSPEVRFAVRCESSDPAYSYDVVGYGGSAGETAPAASPGGASGADGTRLRPADATASVRQ